MDFQGDTVVHVSLMKGAGNRVPQNLIAVGLWALLGQEHSCEICKAEAKQGLLPLKVVVVDAVAVEDAGRPPPVLTLTLRAAPSSLDSFQPKA